MKIEKRIDRSGLFQEARKIRAWDQKKEENKRKRKVKGWKRKKSDNLLTLGTKKSK